MVNLPQNPLGTADIFSLADVQTKLAPVGCRNPYVQYAARKPYILQSSAGVSFPPFVEIARFPTLGYTHLDAQFWIQQPPDEAAITAQVQYYLTAYKAVSPTKPFTGGMLSLPYDQGDEETRIEATALGISARVLALGQAVSVFFFFSVLVEP